MKKKQLEEFIFKLFFAAFLTRNWFMGLKRLPVSRHYPMTRRDAPQALPN
ncbi:MAG: hypothetical protein IT310_12690 [Anaerolineales bacterium]|nr:hypothetical protein [Anaerolineales bacterium]